MRRPYCVQLLQLDCCHDELPAEANTALNLVRIGAHLAQVLTLLRILLAQQLFTILSFLKLVWQEERGKDLRLSSMRRDSKQSLLHDWIDVRGTFPYTVEIVGERVGTLSIQFTSLAFETLQFHFEVQSVPGAYIAFLNGAVSD